MEAFKTFYLGQQRRLAMAGKILFPIPNRRVSKRLYRVTAPTLVLWGEADRLIVPAYAQRWARLIPGAQVQMIPRAGHMLPYEQPEAFVDALARFLGMSDATGDGWIGRPLKRREDHRLLTGAGSYVDDMRPAGLRPRGPAPLPARARPHRAPRRRGGAARAAACCWW